MPDLRPVTLDCIIFGLQRYGGISNYWAKLLKHVVADPALDSSLVLPRWIRFADFDQQATSKVKTFRERLDPRVARYLAARVGRAGGVFHTSYYRLPQRPVGKFVVSVYDFTYERYRDGLAQWAHTTQKLRAIRRADLVLCISESTRRDVLHHCSDIDPAKLHVIPLGVDGDAFFPEPLGSITETRNQVLFVGQRGGYKRFDLAVQAVRQLPDLSLGVVGPALSVPERDDLTKQLGTRWTELGPVDNQVLRRLYSSAFAFIFPSDYEGFGLPVLEAMACGCPVVLADNSSLPEVGGDAALYARGLQAEPYAFALQSLQTIGLRERAIVAGLQRARQFPWSKTLQQTVGLYLQ
jgi:mannosyltransferase